MTKLQNNPRTGVGFTTLGLDESTIDLALGPQLAGLFLDWNSVLGVNLQGLRRNKTIKHSISRARRARVNTVCDLCLACLEFARLRPQRNPGVAQHMEAQ